MQLVFTVREGATPAEIAAHLKFQAGVWEGMTPTEAASKKHTDKSTKTTKTPTVAANANLAVEEEDDFTTTTKTATTDSFGDEDDFTAPTKTAKTKTVAKKFTLDDVNNACKEKSRATSRDAVLKLLKTKFKVASVTELKEDEYGAVVEAMKA